MTRYALGRLAWSAVVLWFVVSVTFVIAALLPADPVRTMLGPHADPKTVAQVRKKLKLDRPLGEQYVYYVGRIARGDLGESFKQQRPVTQILGEHVWPTAQLALASLFLQVIVGVPLGMLAASRRNSVSDAAAQVIALVGQSAPTFFVGPLFMYWFAYLSGLFPVAGYGEGLPDRLWHLALPAATIAVGGVAYYSRMMRAEMIEALGEDYVRTARAKGLDRWEVEGRHAARNALLPVVTLVGLDLGTLMGGAIVTEYIFSWPGLGREAVNAIFNIDMPVILGVVLVSAVAILVANLLVDLAIAGLDPRVRLA